VYIVFPWWDSEKSEGGGCSLVRDRNNVAVRRHTASNGLLG
jgi:hypothetical protein